MYMLLTFFYFVCNYMLLSHYTSSIFYLEFYLGLFAVVVVFFTKTSVCPFVERRLITWPLARLTL
jgi:hypothetical protein